MSLNLKENAFLSSYLSSGFAERNQRGSRETSVSVPADIGYESPENFLSHIVPGVGSALPVDRSMYLALTPVDHVAIDEDAPPDPPRSNMEKRIAWKSIISMFGGAILLLTLPNLKEAYALAGGWPTGLTAVFSVPGQWAFWTLVVSFAGFKIVNWMFADRKR